MEKIEQRVKYAEVKPQPKDTIDGLLKLMNRHDLTYAQMVYLRHVLFLVNGKDIFQYGEHIKVPVVYDEGKQKAEAGNQDEQRARGWGEAVVKAQRPPRSSEREMKESSSRKALEQSIERGVEEGTEAPSFEEDLQELMDRLGVGKPGPVFRKSAAYRRLLAKHGRSD
jgi:hypothetical protein